MMMILIIPSVMEKEIKHVGSHGSARDAVVNDVIM